MKYIDKPFKRNIRPFSDGTYHRNRYILHEEYAKSPEHYFRAFNVLLKDFIELLDYIEPADINLKTYSYRIHELLLRTCIEIESNFVAILSENGYMKKGNWKMKDFFKINQTHHLSSYEVMLPMWKGDYKIRNPFKIWSDGEGLPWFQAYNKTKHNRHSEFEKANFKNFRSIT